MSWVGVAIGLLVTVTLHATLLAAVALAAEMGLGTNRLADIKVVGPAISDVMKKFKPSY